jgi:hypothetical protein
VLVLGCRDAAVGRILLTVLCHSYLASPGSVTVRLTGHTPGSAAMVESGNALLHGTSGGVEMRDIEEFSSSPASFDFIVSRLALHCAEDLAPCFTACHACLPTEGRVVFSVLHPVPTSLHPILTSRDSETHDKRGN